MGRDNLIKNGPEITVLMSVYNNEKYLKEAIESILNQTFKNFEFIIINDGSIDKSINIIKSFKDKRIIFLNNKRNIGLTKSLNIGLKSAKGKYLARMDADDISLPQRLEKQIEFLKNNPKVAVCGSWIKIFGDLNDIIIKFPVDNDSIKCNLLFGNSIAHPSTMINLDLFKKKGFYYNPDFITTQDYELWTRVSEYFELANLDEVLLYLRYHNDQIRVSKNDYQFKNTDRVYFLQVTKLGINPDKNEIELHRFISLNKIQNKRNVKRAFKWLIKLIKYNKRSLFFSEKNFINLLYQKWICICDSNINLGLWMFIMYLKFVQKINYKIEFNKKIQLLKKYLLKK